MKHVLVRCAALAFLGLAAVTLSDLGAAEDKQEGKSEKKSDKKEEKEPLKIAEIMKRSHAKGGAHREIMKQLESEKVNWDLSLAKAKDLILLAGDLERNKPPVGDKEAWDKQAKNYLSLVVKLEKAIEQKDLAETKAAVEGVKKSCSACHNAHRPKEDE